MPRATVRRPFEHQRHEALECRGCHGAGATHRVTRVQSSSDCAACHHDPGRGFSCATCHRDDAIPAERPVPLRLALKVTAAPRTRDVRFRHAAHLMAGSGLSCTSCHATPVTLQRNRECASCHTSHHEGRAKCASCHAPPPRGAHQAAAHLSCAGGGCHDVKAPAPASSRALCLYCHTGRRDHEPGGDCALCHGIPGARPAPAERTLGAARRTPP